MEEKSKVRMTCLISCLLAWTRIEIWHGLKSTITLVLHLQKQKVQQESGANSEISDTHFGPKLIRQFPQKKPVATNTEESKPRLSKDILAGIFGGTS
ncbi:unnamed protein product [Coffea canephora]|uniref:Uncharacterized protein n=1 Tax=Coffea canephora TaxID=49390 RepID=A0A068ULS5_COFCA|nr:unnamed protein product [Coffea canephora]